MAKRNRSSPAYGTGSTDTDIAPGRLSMLAGPNTSSTDTDTAELLWKLSSFGFSLLSPNDQQDKIEQISKQLAAGVADVKRLEGETEEDFRRKKFAELFNKAPVLKRYNLFKEFTHKFFFERKLCKKILLFRQLDSNEQQEWIEKMLNEFIGEIDKDVILERLSEESEEDFRVRRFIKLCGTDSLLLHDFIMDEAKDWDLKSLHMQKSGKEEIELITQSRYAEFYLGLARIWFKARWASDPKGLIDLIIKVGEGDHIIEKLANETEEDFRLRRFTESFKQLKFSSQEEFVECINNIVAPEPLFGSSSAFPPFAPESSSAFSSSAFPPSAFLPFAPRYVGHFSQVLSYEPPPFAPESSSAFPPFAPEFKKVRTAILGGLGGAVATQGGQGRAQANSR